MSKQSFATIMRRLDDLEAKGVQEVQIVNEGVTQLCLICKSTEWCAILSHSTSSARHVFEASQCLMDIQAIF